MWNVRSAMAAVLAVVFNAGGSAQTPDPRGASATTPSPENIHWAIRLGMRVDQVKRAFPMIDRAVIVPDTATYLDELSKWSLEGRWPVLLADDHFTPMFLRAFKPAQTVRRASVLAPDGHATTPTRQQLEAIVIRVWGGNPELHSIREAFDRNNYVPPGVVIGSVDDPAWTAAVALAAGRGQPLLWLDDNVGRPNQLLDRAALDRLLASVDELVGSTGYEHADIGDAIDAITMCRMMAGRANLSPNADQEGVRAITDVLGRKPSGARYAFTGWIFGDEVHSVYMAMCSLFLDRSRVWLYNTYPDEEGWAAYGFGAANERLTQNGYTTKRSEDAAAGQSAWLRMLVGGIDTDVLAINSKGHVDYMELSSGTASAIDVPMLTTPVALHLIHSWSMRSPQTEGTLGAQWLAHGAYAYVGSVHEPLLQAFVPPAALAERWTKFAPFLVSARVWAGHPQFAGPWRINTVGDPLMLCAPPAREMAPRVAQPADYGIDLKDEAVELMRRASNEQDGDAAAKAIKRLELLGKDETAAGLWKAAAQQEFATTQTHAAALGALFRMGEVSEFLTAWSQASRRDHFAVDMLWHLMTPRLQAASNETLMQLQSVIRPEQAHVDAGRLYPHLAGAFGQAHARRVVQREVERATSRKVRRELQSLLQRP